MSHQNAQKPEAIRIELKRVPREEPVEHPVMTEPDLKKTLYKSPYEKAGYFSKLNFLWMADFVNMVNKMKDPVKLEHIPESGSTETAECFEKKIQYQYDKWKKNNPGKTPKLFIPAMLGLLHHLIPTYIIQFFFTVCRVLFCYFLNQTISALSDMTVSTGTVYLWALGLLLCIVGCFYFHAMSFYQQIRATIQLKIGIILMLFKKINRVSLWSLQQMSLGKVINLAANDVNLFDVGILYACSVFMVPVVYIGCAILLWSFFGPVCLIGIGYIVLIQPIQSIITRMSKDWRMMKNKLTDERVKMTNEAIDSIRLLKMYGWDTNFSKHIESIRKREIKYIKRIAMVDFLKNAISYSSSAISSFLIFLLYALEGNTLTPSKVFPTVFICNYLRIQGGLFVVQGINLIMDGGLFFDRVVQLLELPEVATKPKEEPKAKENAIEYQDYFGYWQGKSPLEPAKPTNKNDGSSLNPSKTFKPTLSDINLKIRRGSLNAIIGKIGSGKTTLLLSLAGEIPYYEGSLRYKGKMAYVEQEPMIFSSTLRENILFGNPYDPEFYNEVIEGCCLVDDIKLFANGDLTEIGEKGINLSGGQKARVSLARAVYSRSDIYLLDDPLSAVDAKVAKKLFENAITGLLKDKTVLLATHQVHFVKGLDRIIVMDHGKVIGDGNYAELKNQNLDVEKIFVESKTVRRHSNAGNVSYSDVTANGISAIEDEEEEKEEKEKEKFEDNGKLVADEDTKSGQVTPRIYFEFLKSMFSPLSFIVYLIAVASVEITFIAYNRIIGYWSTGKIEEHKALVICGSLAGATVILSAIRSNIWARFSLSGAEKIHNTMLNSLMRSPVSFFDSNPVGRILNRFSNDIGVMDKLLNWTFNDCVEGLIYLFSMLIVVWIVSPFVTIPSVLGLCLYGLVTKKLVKSIKVTKGLELVSRSPIYSLFSMTLSGLITVRSYAQSPKFITNFTASLNQNAKASYYYHNVVRVIGLRLDQSSSVYVLIGCIIIIAIRNGDSGLNGFALLYLMSISEFLQWNIRQLISNDMLLASAARVFSYTKLPSEAQLTLPEDSKLKEANWPQKGEVHFNKVFMRYRENLDHVIRGLDIKINPGEKIGCVGRTGAGKSSIIQMLFRTVEIDKSAGHENSSITIDGVDIMKVGLHTLRYSISIIPQTPVVFSGTIRRNLDPLGQHSDDELWNCLNEVNLKKYVDQLEEKLDTDMTNATSVFSVGQKQLVCLARAILTKSKIIVLDEATANVDFQTDTFIQKKIMEKFADTTVFTIAHRLSTIANYDRVLVLDKGICVEFDEPYKLLVRHIGDTEITNPDGNFASMVLNTGSRNSHYIFEICRSSYFKRHPEQK
jgi:ATP-binding cassette, subfamily C (CFTR/MRP), member 4